MNTVTELIERVLASAIAFTIDYAHTWLHRNHQETT